MASQRLVRYAEYIDAGMDAKNAAIKAGYADSTAARASVDLTPQAIRAGLLPDPDQRAELVKEYRQRERTEGGEVLKRGGLLLSLLVLRRMRRSQVALSRSRLWSGA